MPYTFSKSAGFKRPINKEENKTKFKNYNLNEDVDNGPHKLIIEFPPKTLD